MGRERAGWMAIACAFAATAVLGLAPAPARAAEAGRRMVVELRPGAPSDLVARRAGVTPVRRFARAIDGFSADLTSADLARLRRDPQVRRVDGVDRRLVVADGTSRPRSPSVVAADPHEVDRALAPLQGIVQTVLDVLGLGPPAQQVPSALARVGATAAPTIRHDRVDDPVPALIALIDTGVERHPDLHVVGGRDCIGGGAFADDYGHGTLVAGVAAAVDNAIDVVGVAPGASVLSAKAVDARGHGTLESLLCALDWAMDPAQRTDVINVSLAWDEGEFGASPAPCGTLGSDPIHEAICTAVARGITVVAAAGNDGLDASHLYPAAYPEVITVSGIADFDGAPGGHASPPACGQGEIDDHLRSVSNFGDPVDIDAVATCVLTTAPGGGLVLSHGTSLAAPAVSGAVALVRAAHPGASPDEVRQRILDRAMPGPVPGDPDRHAEPVLDVSRL